ncbi:MAG: type II toxin-antitoxin system HicA family toxin [Parcubacteria group bacterium]|nr:type II toxin-antitoxin system HicA family toxin [Parcubacteria group bacterium]
MGTRLKNITAREWLRALERGAFVARKSRGSHHFYQHSDGRRVLIVYHKLGDTFGPKTIRQILKGTGWRDVDLKHFGLIK